MDFTPVLISLMLTSVAFWCLWRREKNKSKYREHILNEAESRINNFSSDYTVTTIGNHARFCVDTKCRHVAVIEIAKETDIINLLPYEDILRVALVKDGQVTITKSTSRAIGGAMVGGLVGGIGGMVVGGLSGNQQVNTSVEKVTVVIKTRNMGKPSIEIDCMKGSFDSETALKDAQKIADLVSIIIDQVDKEQKE